jgi:hypothetical protein
MSDAAGRHWGSNLTEPPSAAWTRIKIWVGPRGRKPLRIQSLTAAVNG